MSNYISKKIKRVPKDGTFKGIVYHLFNFVGTTIHDSFAILTLNGKRFELPVLILDKKSLQREILERKSLLA